MTRETIREAVLAALWNFERTGYTNEDLADHVADLLQGKETSQPCCSSESVVYRASISVDWTVAGSAVYSDEERDLIEGVIQTYPDADLPSIYCEACPHCGVVVRGWIEPDPLFNPPKAEFIHPESKP